jgi:hypothetical protein
MEPAVLVDTDVLIDFLRGRDEAVAYVQSHVDRLILSSIVVAELYAGVKGDAELAVLDQFVESFEVVPLTSGIARAGGLLRRDYGKSHGVGLADAVIAATAQVHDAELGTLNVKHFPMLTGLTPAYVKSK